MQKRNERRAPLSGLNTFLSPTAKGTKASTRSSHHVHIVWTGLRRGWKSSRSLQEHSAINQAMILACELFPADAWRWQMKQQGDQSAKQQCKESSDAGLH
mmetsp:Transcript_137104/g.273453  ORF Transcript_137104/g.273453 Transcript_137104/m.273453 type:complete len:100 (+) Transcript_137104:158-457(+)